MRRSKGGPKARRGVRRRGAPAWLVQARPHMVRAGAIAGLAGAAGWLFLSGAAVRGLDATGQALLSWTADAGLRVADVLVDGRVQTSREALLDALSVRRGDPILAFDPHAAVDELRKIPWISAAQVERRLPDTILVRLTERVPFALWQHDGRFHVIDRDGFVLSTEEVGRFHHLPRIVGAGAERRAGSLIPALERHPNLMRRFGSASWIGDRRWDLRLANGVMIHLPTGDPEAAIAQLDAAETAAPFLDTGVLSVDLRQPDRMAVRLEPAAAARLRPPPAARPGAAAASRQRG